MLLAHTRVILIASYVFCHYKTLLLHWHRLLFVCFYVQVFLQSDTSYFSSSDWSIFCSPTWPSSCNSPRKCTSIKYKARQKAGFSMVHSKTTYEWHTGDRRVHTSDIRMTYEYLRVTYGLHTSDIRMTYEHIRVTYH